MSASLIAGIALLAGGTYAIRLAGPLLRSRITVSTGTSALLDQAAMVLLVAVAVTGTIFAATEFAGWARVLGVLAGAVAAWRRAPLVVVVLVAAAVTAALRLCGIA